MVNCIFVTTPFDSSVLQLGSFHRLSRVEPIVEVGILSGDKLEESEDGVKSGLCTCHKWPGQMVVIPQ